MTRPVHDLPVRVMRLFSAERWPADQALEHDRAYTPPIAAEVVALAAEDFRCDIIWRADGRIGELTPRLAPGVDLITIRDSKLDLIDGDRVSILRNRLWSSLRHQLLIIGSRMFL